MIKLELSSQMIAIIGAALGNMPYAQVAPTIAELQKQIEAQQMIVPPATNGHAEDHPTQ